MFFYKKFLSLVETTSGLRPCWHIYCREQQKNVWFGGYVFVCSTLSNLYFKFIKTNYFYWFINHFKLNNLPLKLQLVLANFKKKTKLSSGWVIVFLTSSSREKCTGFTDPIVFSKSGKGLGKKLKKKICSSPHAGFNGVFRISKLFFVLELFEFEVGKISKFFDLGGGGCLTSL